LPQHRTRDFRGLLCTRKLRLRGRKLGLRSRCVRAWSQLGIDLCPNDASQDLRSIHSGLGCLNGLLGGNECEVGIGGCDGDLKLCAA
jgi:hypothetical protein